MFLLLLFRYWGVFIVVIVQIWMLQMLYVCECIYEEHENIISHKQILLSANDFYKICRNLTRNSRGIRNWDLKGKKYFWENFPNNSFYRKPSKCFVFKRFIENFLLLFFFIFAVQITFFKIFYRKMLKNFFL